MAIAPPSNRNWWKEPVHKVELIWAGIAFLWGIVMFFMMIYWHGAGQQNLSNEAYRTTPADYAAKVDKMIADRADFVREKGLFMHGWVQGMEPHPEFHWARANGWAFLTLVPWIQDRVYITLPDALGFSEAPWWWPLPVLAIAGLILTILLLVALARWWGC